jgi:hypothetical protein
MAREKRERTFTQIAVRLFPLPALARGEYLVFIVLTKSGELFVGV